MTSTEAENHQHTIEALRQRNEQLLEALEGVVTLVGFYFGACPGCGKTKRDTHNDKDDCAIYRAEAAISAAKGR